MATTSSWRDKVVKADPEFVTESQNLPEYEFGPKQEKRIFKGLYRMRGAYAPSEE